LLNHIQSNHTWNNRIGNVSWVTYMDLSTKMDAPPEEQAKKKQKTEEHNNIAKRFMDMCATFDSIKATYTRQVPFKQSEQDYPPVVKDEPYLLTHLKFMVKIKLINQEFKTRTGRIHEVTIKKPQDKDNRYTVPSTIRSAIVLLPETEALWKNHNKVELKWITCYLADIKPNTSQTGWEKFECSHRCIEFGLNSYFCVDASCMTWESKSINQSRGNPWCAKQCSHNCGKIICECQGMHNPPCI